MSGQVSYCPYCGNIATKPDQHQDYTEPLRYNLTIKCSHEYANIFIDGELVSNNPPYSRLIDKGEHKLEMIKDGYDSYIGVVNIDDDKEITVLLEPHFPQNEKLNILGDEQGDAEAQDHLGHMYLKGKGVPQDYGEAFRLFLLSAEQGYAKSQYNLGYMYLKGEGVPQDYTEALRWFRLSAEQGYTYAQNKLGDMYGEGTDGVPQDYAEAFRWFRLSAEQGDVYAQNNIGYMYGEGKGVPKNLGESLKWYALAEKNRNKSAQRIMPNMSMSQKIKTWIGKFFD